jgi:hypothetical protein
MGGTCEEPRTQCGNPVVHEGENRRKGCRHRRSRGVAYPQRHILGTANEIGIDASGVGYSCEAVSFPEFRK